MMDLSIIRDHVLKSWLGEKVSGRHKEPWIIVYDLFSDRDQGAKLTSGDLQPGKNCALVVTTETSIQAVVGQLKSASCSDRIPAGP